MFVDISGLPKHAVVAALWNAAKQQSMFDRKPCMSETRAREVAAFIMESNLPDDRLDWLDSRSMKVDLRGDAFDPYLYDRDNGGEGAAARVIQSLRQNLQVPEHGNQQKVSEVDASTASQIHGNCACKGECTCGCKQKVLPEGGGPASGGEAPSGAQST